LLVVVAPDVVDRIVKPQRDFDLRGMGRQADHGLEGAEALREVLSSVVPAVGLVIPVEQRTVHGFAVTAGTGSVPGALP
jgi:hypothetical protein